MSKPREGEALAGRLRAAFALHFSANKANATLHSGQAYLCRCNGSRPDAASPWHVHWPGMAAWPRPTPTVSRASPARVSRSATSRPDLPNENRLSGALASPPIRLSVTRPAATRSSSSGRVPQLRVWLSLAVGVTLAIHIPIRGGAGIRHCAPCHAPAPLGAVSPQHAGPPFQWSSLPQPLWCPRRARAKLPALRCRPMGVGLPFARWKQGEDTRAFSRPLRPSDAPGRDRLLWQCPPLAVWPG